MYRLINRQRAQIIAELEAIGDVPKYRDLLRELITTKGSIAGEPWYQRRYRAYWRMNAARLPAQFYSRYFEVLARAILSGTPNLKCLVEDLARVSDGSLQFSFATKLAHMIDRRLPVYDSFVAAFYFYEPLSSDKSFAERLSDLLRFYEFLKDEYDRVLADNLLAPAIAELRGRFDLSAMCTDQRLVDWLLWAGVAFIRRSTRAGRPLYE